MVNVLNIYTREYGYSSSRGLAEIWQTDLDRAFTGDFEEYLNSDWENADIDT